MEEIKSKILLIYTGGTIGMEVNSNDGSLMPLSLENLVKHIPELSRLECALSTYSFLNPVDSSEADFEFWNDIAKVIEANYDLFDGFVILHGTDTMAYTASALSIMLENLTKPIVITGSQLPMGMLRTDGRENLISSIEIASLKDDKGSFILQEVAIYFEYSLYRGNRCHKFSTEHFDAIISPNYPPLAEAGVNINWNYGALQRKVDYKKLAIHYEWDDTICVIKFFPGLKTSQLEYALNQPEVKVFILETFGSGNIPMRNDLVDLIKGKVDEGKCFINVSQCRKGNVDQKTYASGLKLSEIGVLSAEDMTFEAVVVKVMHLLGKKLNVEGFAREFQIDYAGELSM